MWFLPALITLLAWGTADLFYKMGNNQDEKDSALKTVIMVGLVMGLHVIGYYWLYQGINYDWKNILVYLPVSSMYILSMAVGYFGLRYIEVSISSPISNSSGAFVVLMSFFFMHATMKPLQWFAVIIIIIGMFLLGVFEKQEADAEFKREGKVIDKKYRISAIAIIFPIIYALLDATGTYLDGVYLDYRKILPEDQANMSYELTFLIVAIVVWLYLKFVKKETVNVFKERTLGLAAIFETLGQFFYVGAMAGNSIIAAPMIASYSIVSIILARIFIKEKLNTKQYIVVAFIILAIAILGFYDA
ncbi:MAG TPA: EamA family transporter [Lapidilactobacillus dextrinicus]|uniref:EamA family transporter n=1 Tax=Lapidilactobacillus dextrinicus TaxID=51664 RepID=A0A921B3A2_9LACO|nr:EamA family transporter [Lapidilactobacillus dextrinicus]